MSGVAQAPVPVWAVRCSSNPSLSLWILFRRLCYSHVSISAEASFPVVPKWILMNLPLQVKKMMLYIKLEAHSKRDWNNNTDSPLWHLKEHPSVTRNLQSERSCHSSQSWRCQRPPAGGWHWWSDPPESPAKAKSSVHIWGLGVSYLTAHMLTWQPDPPAFCLKLVPPSSSPQWLQLLQSTGWHVSCSQSFLPRILRCQTVIKYMWEFKLYDKWNCFLYHPWLSNVPVFICLCQSP